MNRIVKGAFSVEHKSKGATSYGGNKGGEREVNEGSQGSNMQENSAMQFYVSRYDNMVERIFETSSLRNWSPGKSERRITAETAPILGLAKKKLHRVGAHMKLDTKPQFLYSLSNKNCVFIRFNSEKFLSYRFNYQKSGEKDTEE